MNSTFTWLDYSERERRAMLDVVDLFREQDTRDEMGLATVRDAFSDLLFPGTGSLQTRARYFLFTPWIYLDLERRRTPSLRVASRGRAEEARVIEALKVNEGPETGVIGARSGAALRRLPSSIYWLGLAKWGILVFPGSQDAYHRSLDRFYERQGTRLRTDDGEAFDRAGIRNWDGGLPPRPEGFPEAAVFALTEPEAAYLQEQVLRRAPGTLLAFLVAGQDPEALATKFPWEVEETRALPEPLGTHLRHARCFAEAMHGAGLLYNLMLCEVSRRDDRAVGYAARLGAWAAEVAERREALSAWWKERELLWHLVASARGAPVPFPVRAFVERWVGWVLAQSGLPAPGASDDARRMVRQREEMLKRGLSRFTNKRALEMWGGSSGAGRLDYRWGSVRRIVADIREGLGHGGRDARTP